MSIRSATTRSGRLLVLSLIVIVGLLAVFTAGFTKWPSTWSKLQVWVWATSDKYDDIIETMQEHERGSL